MINDTTSTQHDDDATREQQRTRAVWSFTVAAALPAVVVISLVAIVLGLSGVHTIDLGLARLGVSNLYRPLVAGTAADLALMISRYREQRWRRLTMMMLALFGFASLIIIARGAGPSWTASDGAIIE